MIKTMTPQVDACAESDQSRQSIWELARKLELKLQKYVPQDDFFDACAERDSLASQLAEKEAECEGLRQDAERYCPAADATNDQFDAAVDAAIAAREKSNG